MMIVRCDMNDVGRFTVKGFVCVRWPCWDCSDMFFTARANTSRVRAGYEAAADEIRRNVFRFDHRGFVRRMREHPESLISWENDEPFDEYARRVEAGAFN